MPETKSYLSQITLPSGSVYYLKDEEARELIAALQKYTNYLGVTTTKLTDGASTNPITINGEAVTAERGEIANYGRQEFIFNGTVWQEFGDLSGLGALAYKDSASADYTPAGTVAAPVFTGEELTSTGKLTAGGTVSQPTFTGDAGSVSVTGTPAGTVSQPTFTGDAMTSTGNFTPAGNITMGVDATGTANYTPSGEVSKPAVTVTPTTANVNSIIDVGTLPNATMPVFSATVENENLTFSWTAGSFNAGTLPTKGADMAVMTGAAAELAAAPTFTGTGVSLKGTFSGTQGAVSVSGTPEGTVSQPTFTGTEVDVSVKGTPAGTNTAPAFTGTQATITVS